MRKRKLRIGGGWGKRGFMIADTGKQLNLSMVGGSSRVIRLREVDAKGNRVETAGKLYSAELRSMETDKRVAGVSVSYAGDGDLMLTLPGMGVGKYVLVVDVSVESGVSERYLSGYVSYLEPGALVKPSKMSVPERVIGVQVDGEGYRCEWWYTSAAEVAADRAESAAERAEAVRDNIEAVLDEAVEEATERSENAAERAEAAAERAEDAEEGAVEASTLAKQLRDNLRARLLEMIKVIDGYLYVDDVNTGHYLHGKDGLQVYISEDGHWYLSDGTYLGWPATGEDGVTPHITADGYWAFGDEVTQYKAVGQDGLDGTAVRRILVDSWADIPKEGETCNGGYYYYTQKADWHKAYQLTLFYAETENQPEGKGFSINGVPFEYEGGTLTEWADAINAAPGVYNCTAEAVDEEHLVLTALEVDDKVAVSVQNIGDYVEVEDTYAIYAWLEREGVGGWEWVGLAYDLATAEVYGLTKLGTDETISGGAVVGNNAAGQLSVPRSSVSDFGAGRIGTSAVLTSANSGVVGMTEGGQYMARKASSGDYGTVKYSRTDNMARIIGVGEVPSGTKVDGIDRAGRLGATRADGHTYGMTKCSYTLTDAADFSDVVYVLPIGMRDDTAASALDSSITDDNSDPWYYGANGHLAVKLKKGGALQWSSSGESSRHGVSFSTGGYLWLRANGSFSQDRSNGLILNEATSSLLGGVRKQTTVGSGSGVPTGTAVINYVAGQLANYYTKSQVYTKAQTESIIDAECAERVPYYAEQTLAQYAKKSDVNSSISGLAAASTVSALASTVNANHASLGNSISDLTAQINAIKSSMSAYVKVGNSGIEELWLGTKTQFAALSSLDENIFYIVLRG